MHPFRPLFVEVDVDAIRARDRRYGSVLDFDSLYWIFREMYRVKYVPPPLMMAFDVRLLP